DLGIQSISLTTTAHVENVGGNRLVSIGSFTWSDGTNGTMDEVDLATTAPHIAPHGGPDPAALAFLQRVQNFYPAIAKGQANGAHDSLVQAAALFNPSVGAWATHLAEIAQLPGGRIQFIEPGVGPIAVNLAPLGPALSTAQAAMAQMSATALTVAAA